jgi:hypothetical protein
VRETPIARFATRVERTEFEPWANWTLDWLRSVVSEGRTKVEDIHGRRTAQLGDVRLGLSGEFTFQRGEVRGVASVPLYFENARDGHPALLFFSRGNRSQLLDFIFDYCCQTRPEQGVFFMPNRDDGGPENLGLDHRWYWLVDGALKRAVVGLDGDAYWLGSALSARLERRSEPGVNYRESPEGVLVCADGPDDRAALQTVLHGLLFSDGTHTDLMISMPHYKYWGEVYPVEKAKDWTPSMVLERPMRDSGQ